MLFLDEDVLGLSQWPLNKQYHVEWAELAGGEAGVVSCSMSYGVGKCDRCMRMS